MNSDVNNQPSRVSPVMIVLTALAVQMCGCGSEGSGPTEAPEKAERDRAAEVVDEFESHLEDHLTRRIVRRAVASEVRREVEDRGLYSEEGAAAGETTDEAASSSTDGSRVERPPRAVPPGPSNLVRPTIVGSIYQRADHRPRWLFRGTARGQSDLKVQRAALSLFESAVRHDGLWPDALHLRMLRKHLAGAAQRVVTAEGLRAMLSDVPASLTRSERRALIERVAIHLAQQDSGQRGQTGERSGGDVAGAVPESPSISMAEILDIAVGGTEAPPVPRLSEWIDAQLDGGAGSRFEERAGALAVRDILLTDAAVHYAGVMRWDYRPWFRKAGWHQAWRKGEEGPLRTGWPMNFKPGESPPDQIQSALSAARRRVALEGWVESRLESTRRGEGSMVERLRSLRPTYPPYERLAELFPAYRGVVQRGGWPDIPESARGLGPGDYATAVETVKRRLAVEGYYPQKAEPGAYYGDALAGAVRTYQSTHQLRRTSEVDAPTWRSLNVSAQTRFHQMRVTLQRWRESRATDDSHYIRVNIPGFHVAVWRDGQRQMRFRVMVGQTTTIEDKKTGEVRWPHATPRFSDTMRYLVFNPFWNVPHSIRTNEIEPKLKENPDYLEEERLEKVTDPNGYTYYRQKPGPKNALGRVKFLFPNEMSIYLHDTPHHALFRRPFRALSHGCIRVESPMKLVDYLLNRDGRWTQKERLALMKDWFAKDSESWVRLREPIGIHLEYYVVRADREGRVHFFSDLYDLNEKRLASVEERMASLPGGTDVPAPGDPAWTRAALRGDAPSMPEMPVQFDPAISSPPPVRLAKRDRTVPKFLEKQAERLAKKRANKKNQTSEATELAPGSGEGEAQNKKTQSGSVESPSSTSTPRTSDDKSKTHQTPTGSTDGESAEARDDGKNRNNAASQPANSRVD
jgi:hypothetical protein